MFPGELQSEKHWKLPRWNWIVTILAAGYGLFCELYSAAVLFGGSAEMMASGFDLERVFGVFGMLFSAAALIVEGMAIIAAVSLIALICWGLDKLYFKIRNKLATRGFSEVVAGESMMEEGMDDGQTDDVVIRTDGEEEVQRDESV